MHDFAAFARHLPHTKKNNVMTGTEESNKYTLTNNDPETNKASHHGYLTLSKTTAYTGETVTVGVYPDEDYTFNLNYGTADQKGVYTFKMPAQDITVKAKKRATVAVAHSMMIAIYHILKDGVPFVDLGEDYYTQFNTEKKINHYLKKLETLGWTPSIDPA